MHWTYFMPQRYDVIVVGLGAMGSATTYQLAKAGHRVLGLDQFSPPHTLGSSHGDTRITRQAIGEGAAFVPLVLRSHELWREIERDTDTELMLTTGGLVLGRADDSSSAHGVAGFLANTLVVAATNNIAHEVLDADEIRRRFPQFALQGDEIGYYEPGAGLLHPERCVAAQLELAARYGADLHSDEALVAFESAGERVTVETMSGKYEAEQLILTVGPWLPNLLPETYAGIFKVHRQVLYWFEPRGNVDQFAPGAFPVFIWIAEAGDNHGIYGFPALDGSGVKVATEQLVVTTSPETVDRSVTEAEVTAMYRDHVADRLPGLSPRCVKAVACLYTVTPDFGFVIDRHPEHRNVLLVSPCSGHGFKHSAAIGEAVAQLVGDGASGIDLSSFRLTRFAQ